MSPPWRFSLQIEPQNKAKLGLSSVDMGPLLTNSIPSLLGCGGGREGDIQLQYAVDGRLQVSIDKSN
jgi:hypothetical protein